MSKMQRAPDLDQDGMKAYCKPGFVLRVIDCEEFNKDKFPLIKKLFEAMVETSAVDSRSHWSIDQLARAYAINKVEARHLRMLMRNHLRDQMFDTGNDMA